ncbi:unnamed protein product [Lampetra planeri]
MPRSNAVGELSDVYSERRHPLVSLRSQGAGSVVPSGEGSCASQRLLINKWRRRLLTTPNLGSARSSSSLLTPRSPAPRNAEGAERVALNGRLNHRCSESEGGEERGKNSDQPPQPNL